MVCSKSDRRTSIIRGCTALQPRPQLLIGRDRELAQLRAALDQAKSGTRVTLEFTGPAGIGKTSLTRWLAAEAESQDFIVLSATGFDSEQGHPHGVLLAMFDDALSADQSIAEHDPYDIGDLAPVLPGLRGKTSIPNATSQLYPLLVCRA